MKKIISILFYFCLILLFPITVIVFLFDTRLATVPLTFGLAGISLYFAAKTIRDEIIDKERSTAFTAIFQVIIILTSFSMFFLFGHLFVSEIWRLLFYGSLFVMFIFVVMSLYYFIKNKQRYAKLTATTIVYLLLLVLMGAVVCVDKSIRNNQREPKYDFGKRTGTDLAQGFENPQAEYLYSRGFNLMEIENYDRAIVFFEKALEVEPNNVSILFDLANCHMMYDLDLAISLFDKAIALNDSYAPLYGNRGLCYYKMAKNDKALEEFQKAIKLDVKQGRYDRIALYHLNSAFAYYYKNELESSCRELKMAEKLGYDFSKDSATAKFVDEIKEEVCNGLPKKDNVYEPIADLQTYQINDFHTIYYNLSMPIEDVRIVGDAIQRLKGYFPANQRIRIIFLNDDNNYSIKFFVSKKRWQEPTMIDELKNTVDYIKDSGIEKIINLILIDNQTREEKQIMD